MPAKRAFGIAATPDAPLHFLFPPACRTPTRCTPLRAGEALDASQFGLVGQIGHILPIFPLGHALVVMASAVLVPDAVWIADEEGADALLLAERNHPPRALMPQVP